MWLHMFAWPERIPPWSGSWSTIGLRLARIGGGLRHLVIQDLTRQPVVCAGRYSNAVLARVVPRQ
jgi:hypothetical protein